MKLKKLYSRATNGKVNTFEIEVEGNKYRTITGYQDMKLTTSEWTVCEAKSYCSAEEQALKEATAIHRKKIETGSFEDISQIDNKVFFEPMLAKDFGKEKHKIKYPCYTQPKLDGIRCIVRKDGMWSRNGKKIISAPHIFKILEPLFELNPDLIFDGELYSDKFANDFNKICSLVKKTKPTVEDIIASANLIQYHVYDLPSYNATFVSRFQHLYKMLTDYHESIVVVKTEQVDNVNDIFAYYEDYVISGYEGQIIRLDGNYENKRSKYLLKHKSFIDEEYTILGVEEGIGNKTGMVGSFIFQNKNGKQFNSSPKFNWEECTKMWNERESLIGKSATVKYFNLTPDGVPRFGFVTKVAREDYE
jgi:DNA ligase 1